MQSGLGLQRQQQRSQVRPWDRLKTVRVEVQVVTEILQHHTNVLPQHNLYLLKGKCKSIKITKPMLKFVLKSILPKHKLGLF